ncbi:MAG: cell envelope integrity protein CreD [bacterium]|nr:cell envelope integrity protein CreD [bacterium]
MMGKLFSTIREKIKSIKISHRKIVFILATIILILFSLSIIFVVGDSRGSRHNQAISEVGSSKEHNILISGYIQEKPSLSVGGYYNVPIRVVSMLIRQMSERDGIVLEELSKFSSEQRDNPGHKLHVKIDSPVENLEEDVDLVKLACTIEYCMYDNMLLTYSLNCMLKEPISRNIPWKGR